VIVVLVDEINTTANRNNLFIVKDVSV